jgi:hypothetical protein
VTRNGAAIDVKGLTSFTNDLRAVADDEPKAMKRAYGRTASHVQSRSRSNATAAGGQFAKAKSAIRGSSDHESASVGVSRSGRIPYAQGTFWGARGRFGWYAAQKYANSDGRQFPEWVGTDWRPGVTGEGPLVINYTVDEERPEIIERFADAVDEMFGRSFPD